MPAVSQAQYRYIQGLKKKHVTRDAAPDADKWVFDAEWTEGVDFKKLPKRAAMTPADLLAAALCKAAATGLPGLFAKNTGTAFDPNSAMDRYNMSALEGGAPTMDLNQWNGAGRPNSFSPPSPAPQPAAPPAIGWGASAGPQAAPMDRQMTAPQPPPAPPAPDPWATPPPSGGPQAPSIARAMTAPQPPPAAPAPVPGAPPPGMVGSGPTGQPPETPMSFPPFPDLMAAQPYPPMSPVPGAPPQGMVGSGPTGQPDPWASYGQDAQPVGGDDIAAQAGEADDWAQMGAPADQMQTPGAPPPQGAPQQPGNAEMFGQPQIPPGGMTPIADPWEELTNPAVSMGGGIPPSEPMAAGQSDQQPRINKLTGKPFGWVPQGPDTMEVPPKAHPVNEAMPPLQVDTLNTLEQRKEYASQAIWPAYQQIQQKARAGIATPDELRWMGGAGRMFDNLESETMQMMDTDRMRYLRHTDPEAWLDMRDATAKMPRFNMQHGGWMMQ